MTFELSRRFTVQAAHRLPNAPAGHPCRSLHGHTFRIDIVVTGEPVEPEGWVCDFGVINEAFEPLRAEIDHTFLNEVAGLENPTCERIAEWIWGHLCLRLPGLSAVAVSENDYSSATYRG